MRAYTWLAIVAIGCTLGCRDTIDGKDNGDSVPVFTDTDPDDTVDPDVGTDADGDGYGADDCDDADPSVNPGATEVPYDGIDNDCDPTTPDDDLDGDGAGVVDDCDDTDPTIAPGLDEVCDSLDNNCDGQVDEGLQTAWYLDEDGDGVGAGAAVLACDAPLGHVAVDGDCNDTSAAALPGGSELCDGLDNDCNGLIDDDATGSATWYADADGDGFGDLGSTLEACSQPAGFLADATDCDDANAAVNPARVEVCNGLDDDCTGTIDDNAVDASTWYADADGDGQGDAATVSVSCDLPVGFVASDLDCDDTDAMVRPGATEVCNGVDDDCNQQIDDGATDAATWYEDSDLDGFGVFESVLVICTPPAGWSQEAGDCDDTVDTINPDALEACNNLDDNCDGQTDEAGAIGASTWYRDLDGDSYGDLANPLDACTAPVGYVGDATDCDDVVPTIYPGAPELCDGLDNDCNGLDDDGAVGLATWYEDIDADNFGNPAVTLQSCSRPAGYTAGPGDCDDDNAAAFPGADEFCDGYDNNCNGTIDEDTSVDAVTWYLDFDGDSFGSAGFTRTACAAPGGYVDNGDDCDDVANSTFPGADELCDGRDNDCDLEIDEGALNPVNWYADADGDGFGDLADVVSACAAPPGRVADSTDCDDARATVRPGGIEVCNGLDDDCNGTADDAAINPSTWYADGDGDGFGNPVDQAESCAAPPGHVGNGNDCDDTSATTFPGADETCDGEDDNCNGTIDDGAVDAQTWYRDADADGFGNDIGPTMACAMPSGSVARGGDCNDFDPAVNPSALETCDGRDENCNGAIDDGAASSTLWYADADADGAGDPNVVSSACTQPSGFITDASDCNDNDPDINPNADELCNSVDDDCDGVADNDAVDAVEWYLDDDADGFGLGSSILMACAQPADHAAQRGDCDDSNGLVNPDAVEICNGLDDDCSGTVDDFALDGTAWFQDADSDGFGNPFFSVFACTSPPGFVASDTDCNDNDPATFPGATEQCDSRDNDCDNLVDEGALGVVSWFADSDGDGFGDPDEETFSCAPVPGSVLDDRDCDDSNPDISPVADEVCNNADDDCDGQVDVGATDALTWYADGDADGFGGSQPVLACAAPPGAVAATGDCDDGDAAINPSAEETCDGEDQDCNGLVDDDALDASTYWRDGDGDGFGDVAAQVAACAAPSGTVSDSTDCDDGLSTVYPGAPELCDGFDNDCDNQVDEGQVGNATWYADVDGDGFGDAGNSQQACSQPAGFVLDDRDCDDALASVSPAAPETCDGVDQDCNGLIDDAATNATAFYADGDGDGVGAGPIVLACAAPADHVALTGDCDDDNPAVAPGLTEVCDNADQDCNGLIDDGATDASTWYRDADGDSYGNAGFARDACSAPAGFVADATDCFDNDAASNPAATEICDGRDNDCNTAIDDGATDARSWYADDDGDGFGDGSTAQQACNQPAAFVLDDRDCDDADPTVNPSAVETCDAVDQDCDGAVDEDAVDRTLWYLDADGDTFGGAVGGEACTVPPNGVLTGGDCDDTDPADRPGAPETCDGEDDDCDGVVDGPNPIDGTEYFLDVDGDGFAGGSVSAVSCASPGSDWRPAALDCNDGLVTAFPGADELCDGVDNDCDNEVDEDVTDPTTFYSDGDGDGFGDPTTALQACLNPGGLITTGGDCDDALVAVNPGAPESCNGRDDDCDALTDEPDSVDARDWFQDADADGFGTDLFVVQACTQPAGYVSNDDDCNDLASTAYPGNGEVCDGIDNNCDGSTDDASSSDAGLWLRDDDGDGYGTSESIRACETPPGYTATGGDCDDGRGNVNPGADELCNGRDDNCDSAIDEDSAVDADLFFADTDGDSFGDPEAPRYACQRPAAHVDDDSDCNDADALVNPIATEVCNARDDDCSGNSDDNNAGCPHPLHYFDGSVYMYSLDALPWQDARAFCYSYGYEMLAINGISENFWADGISDSYSQEKWWTGGNDISDEGTWVWENGDAWGYENWHAGEPNNVGSAPGGEDCLQYNRWGDGTWNDEPCGSAFRFICEQVEGP